jgi:hypothetical protein
VGPVGLEPEDSNHENGKTPTTLDRASLDNLIRMADKVA